MLRSPRHEKPSGLQAVAPQTRACKLKQDRHLVSVADCEKRCTETIGLGQSDFCTEVEQALNLRPHDMEQHLSLCAAVLKSNCCFLQHALSKDLGKRQLTPNSPLDFQKVIPQNSPTSILRQHTPQQLGSRQQTPQSLGSRQLTPPQLGGPLLSQFTPNGV